MPKRPLGRTQKQLIAKNLELHARLEKAEGILRASRSAEVNAQPVTNEGEARIFTLKQAEAAQAESEEKFRKLVEHLPSIVYMNAMDDLSSPLYISPQIMNLLGYTPQEWLTDRNLWSKTLYPDDHHRVMTAATTAGQTNGKFDMEYRMITRDGLVVWVQDQAILVNDMEGHPKFWQGIMLDITVRKQTEEALQQSESSLRSLIEYLPTVVYTNAIGDISSTLYVSPQIMSLLGYTPQEWLADPKLWSKTLHPKDYERVLKEVEVANLVQKPFDLEYRMIARDGHLVWVHDQVTPVSDPQGQLQLWQGVMLDITERKMADEIVQKERGRAQQYLDIAGVMFLVLDVDRKVILINKKGCEILGYTEQEILGRNWVNDFLPDTERDRHAIAFDQLIKGRMDLMEYYENAVLTKSGQERLLAWHNSLLTDETDKIVGIVSSGEDVTERKRSESEIHQRLNELEVLYQSGLALIQLVNPKAIAQKMIDLLDQKMHWYHTAIHIYDPQTETLELLVFNKSNLYTQEELIAFEERLRKSITYSGGGFSGWVIQHGKTVRSNHIQKDPRYVETFPGLQSGLYVPVKIAEHVIGVISIESELPGAFSKSDERLVVTLATQTAIAMENAKLFQDLKRSNIDLGRAYDATIEGWSCALDLRDRETEGHSQRVTEMAVNLARSFGLSESELVQVRWGALLHDIGKMGVPDSILLKPSSLTDEEWTLMKKHPRFAYDLLSPIRYLRLALDIPYCHHEKWDGSGYPRGLRGEQIPLSARIFAVVDVWDALCSDRSYRAGWSKEKVREHIAVLSGTHFDPQVVAGFMHVIE